MIAIRLNFDAICAKIGKNLTHVIWTQYSRDESSNRIIDYWIHLGKGLEKSPVILMHWHCCESGDTAVSKSFHSSGVQPGRVSKRDCAYSGVEKVDDRLWALLGYCLLELLVHKMRFVDD